MPPKTAAGSGCRRCHAPQDAAMQGEIAEEMERLRMDQKSKSSKSKDWEKVRWPGGEAAMPPKTEAERVAWTKARAEANAEAAEANAKAATRAARKERKEISRAARAAREMGIHASVARAAELLPAARAIAEAQQRMAQAQHQSMLQFQMRAQMQSAQYQQQMLGTQQMQGAQYQQQTPPMPQMQQPPMAMAPHGPPPGLAAAVAVSQALMAGAGGAAGKETPSLLQWRGKVIEELAADSAAALESLKECCGLRWEGQTREPRVGKLNFGRVAPVLDADGTVRTRAMRIVLRNQRPEPVFLTHLVRLPESDRFELLYATGEGLSPEGQPADVTGDWAGDTPTKAFRVLKQRSLPLTLAGDSSVELRVDFRPSELPGSYDQWLLLRFEVERQGSVFNFVAQNAVLGLVACATCLSSEDAAVLWNVEAKPFLPQWLRNVFAHKEVELPAPHIAPSMGTAPARPPAYPDRVCGVCRQGLWDAFCVADKDARAAVGWDGVCVCVCVCVCVFVYSTHV